ncbi:hypothetical protein ZIOFF_036218 [Zingiber officinale]|uniref:Nucleoside diphosphate kinase n=1 Tax=Zingiber officinale TaxID=94328 RepID=A0A8J5GFW0_ZINOF|nr:hypothetical protein ZIOFF_036218 [Zingiber officinale]
MVTDRKIGGAAVEVTNAGDILSMVRLKALKTPGSVRMAAEENRHEGLQKSSKKMLKELCLRSSFSLATSATDRNEASAAMEQTFIMIKPDGVQRGLVCSPFPSPLISSSFASFIHSSALHCVKILPTTILFLFSPSTLEKKGEIFLVIFVRRSGLKLVGVERSFAEKHYADLSAKPFFGSLVEYIISGPVVAMVWTGKNVVVTGRKIIGATNPAESAPGTIRGDYAIEIGRNVIHGSDSVESARKEIALWFPEGISEWQSNLHPWIYELANEIHEVGDAVNRRFRMNPNVIPMRPANAAKVIEKPASLLRLLRLFNIS